MRAHTPLPRECLHSIIFSTFLVTWLTRKIRWTKLLVINNMGYSFWLTARALLYTPSQRKDSTYHGTGWNEKLFNGYTMRDQSNNPSHHERILYHGHSSYSLKVVVLQIACCQVEGQGACNFQYSILQNVECHWWHNREDLLWSNAFVSGQYIPVSWLEIVFV